MGFCCVVRIYSVWLCVYVGTEGVYASGACKVEQVGFCALCVFSCGCLQGGDVGVVLCDEREEVGMYVSRVGWENATLPESVYDEIVIDW